MIDKVAFFKFVLIFKTPPKYECIRRKKHLQIQGVYI
jgi:hypothetical protein